MEENLLKERKEMLLSLMSERGYVPMKLKELAILLDVPKERRKELSEVLDALVSEGKIGVSKKGKYARAEVLALTGTFSAHPRGFGFVSIEGRDGDLFIAPDNTGDAMNGDTVLVRVSEETDGRRAEGVILKVVKHANETVIGLFEKNKRGGFVIPDNPKILTDIYIPAGKENGAVSGHKVVVRLSSYGGRDKNPEGKVVEILGHINDPGVDILSIIRAYGLPEQFPEEVMDEAASIPEELTPEMIEAELSKGRVDLRHIPMVTIDGEDAKDLDDAVSLSKESVNGHTIYHLGVHIADVTHYVREGHPLDTEAYKRGTSVYLVDRVIPMLPHRLSNGICSLNAGCDRLTLSCLMDVDERGVVVSHKICESVVRIDRRMTYTAVNAILEAVHGKETEADHEEPSATEAGFGENPGEGSAHTEVSGTIGSDASGSEFAQRCLKEYAEFVPLFCLMDEAAKVLRKKRRARGAVDFDFPESKIILDEKGRPVKIIPYERNAATRLIEDFMLAANETVAEEYYWQQVPFLYRIHEKPDPEKIRQFGIFINNFGYSIRLQNGELHPKEMQKLMEKVDGKPEEALLSRLALRSMRQAKYSTECVGHFGLAAQYYTHFTSPIRRYPDLQIHRIIKENLHGELGKKRLAHYEKILGEAAVWTSARERVAEEAERETDKAKKAQYMERHIGEEFDGVISGVMNYGFFVELPNTVEGLVRVSELDGDYYEFDKERYELVGEFTRKRYKLGQSVRVRVVSVDRYMKTIDFVPAGRF